MLRRPQLFPFALGLGTALLQALLLRRFLWEIEAGELGVGLFLAAWLAWLGLAAAASRGAAGRRVCTWLAARGPVVLLAYLPLAAAQYALLSHLRALTGVPAYAAFPLGRLTLGCLLVNAPVSLGTGFLFPAAAAWLAQRTDRAAERACAWDALGAAIGGLLVSSLLVLGVPLDGRGEGDWQRLFPGTRPARVVQTARARYLVGLVGDSLYTLTAGGAVETYPERTQAPEVAALVLAQRPAARRVLLLGQVPLAWAVAFQQLAPRAEVRIGHSDPAYAAALLRWASPRFPELGRLRLLATSPTETVGGPAADADLLVLCPPALSGVAGAHWVSAAFLRRVRSCHTPDGVVAMPLGLGGGGTPSAERLRVAAGIVAGVQHVWRHATVVNGGGGWVLGTGDAAALVSTPEAVAASFAGVAEAAGFPAAAAAQLYDRGNAAVLHDRLVVAAAGRRRPGDAAARLRGDAWSELFRREFPRWDAGRAADALRAPPAVARACCCLTALAALPVFSAWLFAGRRARVAGPSAVAGARPAWRAVAAMLAAGGALGLAGLLAVMAQLQVRHGALYLLAATASACYLGAAFVGNSLARRLPGIGRACGLTGVVALHATLLGTVLWVSVRPGVPAWGFVLLGGCVGAPAGAYAPVAAARLRALNAPEPALAAWLIQADAFGSAFGGLAYTLVLSPLLGAAAGVWVLTLLAFALACLAWQGPRAQPWFAAWLVLLGLAGGTELTGRLRSSAASRTPGTFTAHARGASTRTTRAGAGNTNAVVNQGPLEGRARSVDLPRIRRQTAAGKLSDQRSDFWDPEE